MALSLEDPNLVWQRVKAALANANPAVQAAFKGLKEYLAQQKGNPQLQFVPFSNSTSATDGICQNTGYSPIGGVASRVYAIYAKNDGTGDGTDSFISLHNATDNASAALGATLTIQDDNDEVFAIKHDGWSFATDVTISGATTIGGATESAAANAANGFVILGAA